jgi:hypothetical protein
VISNNTAMSLLLLRPGEEANITCTRNMGPSPFHGGGAGHELVLPPGALGNVRIRCVRDDASDLDDNPGLPLNAPNGGPNGMSVSASEYKAPQQQQQRVFVRHGESPNQAQVVTSDGAAQQQGGKSGALSAEGSNDTVDPQAAAEASGADGVGLLCMPIRGKAKILALLKQNEEGTRQFYDKYKPKPPHKHEKKDKHHGKHKK